MSDKKTSTPIVVEMGQDRATVAPTLEGTIEELFGVGNPYGVYNGAISPTTFTNNEAWTITAITTYHWNDGNGVEPTGTIGLQAADGTMYGPWETTGVMDYGIMIYTFWTTSPNVQIPPGTYTVIDSDPDTWAQNDATEGAGFVTINGIRE